MHAGNQSLTRRKPTASSRITNGSKLLMADGRSPWARRFRDIVAIHCSDLGGFENLSAAELAIIKRAATLQVELEAQEALLASGEGKTKVDLIGFAQVSNGLRRLLETMHSGCLKRIPKDADITLADIIRHAEAAPASKPINGVTGASKMVEGTILEGQPLSPISEPHKPGDKRPSPVDSFNTSDTEGHEAVTVKDTAPASNPIDSSIAGTALDIDHVEATE